MINVGFGLERDEPIEEIEIEIDEEEEPEKEGEEEINLDDLNVEDHSDMHEDL